ncbi:hypothetical protein E4U42_007154 [Claviceps africana]|uniref:DUF8004 domain-containing protein n=1 Tax=Claviceps africana TaxID=83212 RepID=A0A8K0J2B4_9HYPO|nr:hypothetical protein E4U42_007154 [Claviceps africana]
MHQVSSRSGPNPNRPPSRRSPGVKTYLDATATNNRFLTSYSSMNLKRWDGAKQICTNWDALQEDSELFTRNGNCFIYLHSYKSARGKQASKLAASFRLPFSLLLANKCYALIERCLVIHSTDATSEPRRSASDIQKWYRSNPKRRVELFIPPPRDANERQIQRHRILTRNFFAWVLGRSLVGETLGEALVGLLESMYEYRSGDGLDNVADLVGYLDEEGYLCLADQPDHALAVLRLAETFRLKTLYLQALSHCVAMGDMISGRPDFQQHVSLATRKLMQDSQAELDARLEKASAMLRNFLDHELSESQLGIPAGIRAHLERFRTFLLSFYSVKLGYYPPLEFDGCMYRAMARDFGALYNLLVDEGYTLSEAMPSVAVGGICTLQLIQTFDARNGFEPMKHPLPRLPQQDHPSRPGRMSWLSRRAKQRNGDGHLNHVSLVQASNWREDSFDNSLVRAYRDFEEECTLFPRKLDRYERVSLVDGRKIRWILIYAVHQTLQHATQLPEGVPDDPKAAQVLSIARGTKVPWQDGTLSGGIPRSQTEPVLSRLWEQQRELGAQHADSAAAADEGNLEIKPDIDYFALTHRDENAGAQPSRPRRSSSPANNEAVLRRRHSFKQALSSSGTLRRSLRRLNKASFPSRGSTRTTTPRATTPDKSESPPRETEVPDESDAAAQPTLPTELVSRSASTCSGPAVRCGDTQDAVVPTPLQRRLSEMPTASGPRWSDEEEEDASSPRGDKAKHGKRRPMSTAIDGGYNYAVKALGHLVDHERRGGLFGPGRQRDAETTLKRATSFPRSRLKALAGREEGGEGGLDAEEEPYVLTREDSSDWIAMQRFLDDGVAPHGVGDVWEQYADLGGLTEMR